jgi:hypothetical protein
MNVQEKRARIQEGCDVIARLIADLMEHNNLKRVIVLPKRGILQILPKAIISGYLASTEAELIAQINADK